MPAWIAASSSSVIGGSWCLAFGIEPPLASARAAEADDRQRFRPETGKHDGDEIVAEQADGLEPPAAEAAEMGRDDQSGLEIQCPLEFGEVEIVVAQIGEPFELVPDDPHQAICSYIFVPSRAPMDSRPGSLRHQPFRQIALDQPRLALARRADPGTARRHHDEPVAGRDLLEALALEPLAGLEADVAGGAVAPAVAAAGRVVDAVVGGEE